LPPKKNLKSSFPLRFPPSLKSFGRAGKARRAEGGCGGNSARRAQPVPFGYFQTDTALRGENRSSFEVVSSPPSLRLWRIALGGKIKDFNQEGRISPLPQWAKSCPPKEGPPLAEKPLYPERVVSSRAGGRSASSGKSSRPRWDLNRKEFGCQAGKENAASTSRKNISVEARTSFHFLTRRRHRRIMNTVAIVILRTGREPCSQPFEGS